jgi:hypothetical protein
MSRRPDRIDWNDKPTFCRDCGTWPAPIPTSKKKERLCESCRDKGAQR